MALFVHAIGILVQQDDDKGAAGELGDIGSLVIAALVFVYLLVALLKPERFG